MALPVPAVDGRAADAALRGEVLRHGGGEGGIAHSVDPLAEECLKLGIGVDPSGSAGAVLAAVLGNRSGGRAVALRLRGD